MKTILICSRKTADILFGSDAIEAQIDFIQMGERVMTFTPQWMDLSCAGDNSVPRYAVCEKIVEG